MNAQQEKTLRAISKKLGFDPSKPKTKTRPAEEDNWECDDSQQNPFSKLTQNEKDFLEKYIFAPKLHQMRSYDETERK